MFERTFFFSRIYNFLIGTRFLQKPSSSPRKLKFCVLIYVVRIIPRIFFYFRSDFTLYLCAISEASGQHRKFQKSRRFYFRKTKCRKEVFPSGLFFYCKMFVYVLKPLQKILDNITLFFTHAYTQFGLHGYICTIIT